MGIKTIPHPPYSLDLAPCDFWLFRKLRGCRYETIKEMKEAVMKVIDTLTQEDVHGAFQKLLEWYKKCIAAGGDYFKGDKRFMCVLSIKVPIQKKSGNLSYAPCKICEYYCHHHLHDVPPARISLTPSRHFSLSFITSGRSSGLHPVSSHSCCMCVRAGRPAFAWPYTGVHLSTSLISLFLLL